MNTLDIIQTLSLNKHTKKNFQGVFPCDHLPVKVKKPALIVANTDPAHKSGTHWVAFFIPTHGPSEYFDSFGKRPIKKQFLQFLKNNTKSYVYNSKRIQGDFSSTCGHYCCVYLYYKSRSKQLKDFLKEFSKKNYNLNDQKIIHLYTSKFLRKKWNKVRKTKNKNQFGGLKCNKKLFICNQNCTPKYK